LKYAWESLAYLVPQALMIAQIEDDQVMNKEKLGDLYCRKGMCHYRAAVTLGSK
jgi:hypothetical protein